MFAGPTAAEWTRIGKTEGDAPIPTGWQQCAGNYGDCPRHVRVWPDGRAWPDGSLLRPIYGVGCFVRQWETYCLEHRDDPNDDETFYCENCGHEHETNTSWELHYAEGPYGLECLRCHAQRSLTQPDFWLTSPEEITLEYVHSRPHFPTELVSDKIADTGYGLSLDSYSGGELYDEGAGAQGRGAAAVREQVALALREHARVGLIISRAFQFAVYLEVVADAS